MPAFNLKADGSEVKNVSITQTGSNIAVSGTYVVNIKNTGLLPVLMSATVTADKIEVTGVVAEEGKTSTVSGAGEAEFDFSFTEDASGYGDTASSICQGGGQIDIESSGNISGIVLGSSFDESLRTTVPDANCDLGSNGGIVPPEDGEPPEQRPPDDGEGGGEDDDSDDGRVGGGGGNDGPPPEQGEGSLTVVEEPGRDGQATFRMEGEYDAWLTDFIWDFDDGTIDSGQREITHTFDSDGTYDVTCEVADVATNQTIDEQTVRVTVSLAGTPGEDIGGQNIEGPTNVVADETNTWSYAPEEDYDSSEYNITWDMNRDTDYEGQTYEGSFEVEHAYDFQGPKTIQLTVTEPGFLSDNEVVNETYNVDVLDDVGDGPPIGGLSDDEGMFSLEEDQVPSMAEAAEKKNRLY